MSAPRGSATRSRSRSALVAAATALVLGAALAAGLLVGCSRSATPDNPSGWPSVSLSSSLVTPTGSWAIVPMGDLSDPNNTFWQIFFRPKGKSGWSLVTPPGVGANGGLAADPGPGEDMTVVFDPTNLLTFSPFAASSDNGAKWTGGVIPFGIAPVPDVVISSPSEPGQLAALKRGGTEVETGTGTGPQWSVVYTKTQLARSPAGQGCDVGEVTALASAGSDELVGSTCTAPGPVGIFRACRVWRVATRRAQPQQRREIRRAPIVDEPEEASSLSRMDAKVQLTASTACGAIHKGRGGRSPPRSMSAQARGSSLPASDPAVSWWSRPSRAAVPSELRC